MITLNVIAAVFAISFALWRIARRVRFSLHMLQLFGYKGAEFGRWLNERTFDVVFRRSHGIGLGLTALAILLQPTGVFWSIALFLLWAITFSSSRRYRRDTPKKSLVWTARMKRLALSSGIIVSIPIGAGLLHASGEQGVLWTAWFLSGFLLADLFAPIATRFAAVVNAPFERRIHSRFKSLARVRLAERPDLGVIAITGSYGKTSVKFAVGEVLSQRYAALITPGSFNTPMGISKVINEQLTDEHRYLVLEMGMRHEGDIAELARIAAPDIAVLTSIGIAHLESMGSIEAIEKEKLSLLEFLPPEGDAVVNGDDRRIMAAVKGAKFGLTVVSTSPGVGDLWATDISYGPEGSSFTVQTASGEIVSFQTKLLGKHNVINILLALGVGLVAGMRLRQMRYAISRLDPVEHRLQLKNQNGLLVIDDAFNSNPVGAASAVDVLGQFSSGRRVIVTPGMIELGDQEAEANREFGRQIAENVDDALLIGPDRTLPIVQGLRDKQFPSERTHVLSTLFEARDWIAANMGPGDVVLFENDLPDQFTEAPAKK